MKLLLDECVPKRLKSRLGGHECRTTPEMGWSGKSNGEWLGLAAPHFDVLVTIDAGIHCWTVFVTSGEASLPMLALRSSHDASHHLQHQALQIMCLRHRQQNRVILRLCAALDYTQLAAGVERGLGHDFQ